MRSQFLVLSLGALSLAIVTIPATSHAQQGVPTANVTTCGPAFHYGQDQAERARSLILACVKQCGEVLDPLPKPGDPMFQICEDARLHPDPNRAQWYKV